MNNFIQRIASYIGNELFVKGLAESKTFQRFAVHTDRHVQKFQKEGMEHVNSQLDEMHQAATRAMHSATSGAASNSAPGKAGAGAGAGAGGKLKPPQKPKEGVAGFFSALGKVIRRDLGLDK